MFEVIAIPALMDNYIWLIQKTATSEAIAIDPGEAAPLLKCLKINNLSLKSILLTHHHADHIGGVPDLLADYPQIPVYGPNDLRIPTLTHPVVANAQVDCLDLSLQVLTVPGHTASHLCYYEPEMGWLFCGDTLFSAGCGRVFDGSLQTLYQSLMQLRDLPEETLVFCAHEYTRANLAFAKTIEPQNQAIAAYLQQLSDGPELTLPSTIGFEKQINPFLRLEQPEVQEYARRRGCHTTDPLTTFGVLRKDKDAF